MGDRTKIEWTRGEDGTEGATWNPIRARNKKTGKIGWYCEHVSEECRWCYAERWNKARGNGLAYKPGLLGDMEIFLDRDILMKPLHWRRGRKIFPCSMTDLFGDFVPEAFIDQIFAVMACTPHHTYQILTKRPNRQRAYLKSATRGVDWFTVADDQFALADRWSWGRLIGPLRPINVWNGVSIGDQPTANERIPILLDTPSALHWVSYEPALKQVDFTRINDGGVDYLNALSGWRYRSDEDGPHLLGQTEAKLGWVVMGFESGPKARHGDPDIARSVRDQCEHHRTAFYFKQFGQWAPAPKNMNFAEAEQFAAGRRTVMLSSGETMIRYTKKHDAGNTLDGRQHQEFPKVAA